MGRRKRNLEALIAALRGEVPARDCDWMEIVASANRCLVTPALAASLRGKAIPPDAAKYLALILERNTERNLRLKGQIAEAAQALNGIGVTPVMLKGAAWLLTVEHARVGERIIMDLDVMVPVHDMPRALVCLASLGYEIDSQPADLSHHFQADLRRSGDAAMIDLHRRPPGPGTFYDLEIFQAGCEPATVGAGRVLVPSPTLQALHLIGHDQFQDGDYWLGKFDLRHVMDIAFLSRSPQGIDFALLASLMPGRLARHALRTQLLTVHRLLGVEISAAQLFGTMSRIQYRRRWLQIDFPFLRLPLTALTVAAEWVNYREFQALSDAARVEHDAAAADGPVHSGRRERWTRLLTFDGAGKV
jgi:hypothetical protein